MARLVFPVHQNQDLVRKMFIHEKHPHLNPVERRQIFRTAAGDITSIQMPVLIATLILEKKNGWTARHPKKRLDPTVFIPG